MRRLAAFSMRRLAALIAAVVVTLGVPSTTIAFEYTGGWFNTSVIDSNLNGQADLSLCYGSNTNSPIYTNRDALAQEITRWHGASLGAFTSNGVCNNDGSSIEVLALDLDGCEAEVPTHGTLGATELKAGGYNSIRIYFNPQCYDDFDWQDDDGILDNKFSATATMLHEMGHALGLHHEFGDDNMVMYWIGPVHCDIAPSPPTHPALGRDWTLAADDAAGYRARYPGLTDTSTAFPVNAGCAE